MTKTLETEHSGYSKEQIEIYIEDLQIPTWEAAPPDWMFELTREAAKMLFKSISKFPKYLDEKIEYLDGLKNYEGLNGIGSNFITIFDCFDPQNKGRLLSILPEKIIIAYMKRLINGYFLMEEFLNYSVVYDVVGGCSYLRQLIPKSTHDQIYEIIRARNHLICGDLEVEDEISEYYELQNIYER